MKPTRWIGRILAALTVAALCLGVAELLARGLGYRPWQPHRADIRVEPGGSLFEPDPLLGYRHRPGRYRVTVGRLEFTVTHGPDSLRITHPPEAHRSGLPELWIFGGSFTHGWSVSDQQTFPWLLQRRFPRLEVVNFGVNGYGTLHGLLQFEAALSAGRAPTFVIVAYGSYHDDRNTFSRVRRKGVVNWNHLGPLRQPAARLDPELGVRYRLVEADYRPFPGMTRLASVHLLEQAWNRLEGQLLSSRAVTDAILSRFAERAARAGALFIVAGIWRDEPTADRLAACRARGWPTVDISLDLDDPRNNNLPWDPHPSARAQSVYAERLADFLSRQVLGPGLASPGRSQLHAVDRLRWASSSRPGGSGLGPAGR